VTKRKPKYKITPVEAQRRKLDALESWFQFANGELAIATRKNFVNELIVPTAWSLGRRGIVTLIGSSVDSASAEIEEIKMKVANGLKKLADSGEWVIPGAELGNFNIVVSRLGTSPEGDVPSQLLAIAAVLQSEEWRAGLCAWCGRLFMKKKRGEYCGLKCSQRMRTKRVRDPRWRKKEARAKKLGIPAEQVATASK
jgi:hypothetical protein